MGSMNLTLLIVIGVLSVTLLGAFALSRQSVIARAAASIFALGFAAFCGFGFLASFEPSESPAWPWQLAYTALGLASVMIALCGLKGGWNSNKLRQGAD